MEWGDGGESLPQIIDELIERTQKLAHEVLHRLVEISTEE